MSKRDDFTITTKRILAERAGQRCVNPDCGRSTSGPSDTYLAKSTRLGKAAHITAASEGGPRYNPVLTTKERSSPENGIWLCAECADRVDKKENESRYPVELLMNWKKLHESATGTDFTSLQNRSFYPVRKLTLIDFAGVRGEATIDFGALTIFYGTSKLNRTIGELLRIFSDRESFVRTRQPRGEDSTDILKTPITDEKSIVFSASTKESQDFPSTGKLKLNLSDGRDIIICAGVSDVTMSIGDAFLPVFSEAIKVISIGSNLKYKIFGSPFSDEKQNSLTGLSQYFGISIEELKECIKGLPTEFSVFGYNYKIVDDSDLHIKIRGNNDSYSLGMLSGGEQNRFILDMAIRIARYSSKLKLTVLAIDQSNLISLDQHGWAFLLEWVEHSNLPFQVIVDRSYRPSEGNLSHAICYDVIGTDMAVTSFKQLTWKKFKKLR